MLLHKYKTMGCTLHFKQVECRMYTINSSHSGMQNKFATLIQYEQQILMYDLTLIYKEKLVHEHYAH